MGQHVVKENRTLNMHMYAHGDARHGVVMHAGTALYVMNMTYCFSRGNCRQRRDRPLMKSEKLHINVSHVYHLFVRKG